LPILGGPSLIKVKLEPQTVAAFDRYVRSAEQRLDAQARAGRLWVAASPEREQRARKGEVLAEPVVDDGDIEVPGGLIHDWTGAVFIPGVTLDRALAMLQNYDNQKNVYKPEVIDSKVLKRDGDCFTVYLRLLKKKVITVVLDTTHDVQYFRPAPDFAYSRSLSTRIAEVENPGKPNEHVLTPGDDHGFLWRLDSYWEFAQRDGGVYVECEAISLSRGVPTGLGWMINPIVRSLPHESLVNTLRETRDALARGAAR
jgi:hypothetical protein